MLLFGDLALCRRLCVSKRYNNSVFGYTAQHHLRDRCIENSDSSHAFSVRTLKARIRIMISVVILTKDEEKDLPDCLSSIDWCDDIHVVDSGSTDNTVKIAQLANATVYSHPFESFGSQRNWSLDHCQFKYEWVLFLDADEHSTLKFRKALLTAITRADPNIAGYYCCWKIMLNGRWLRRAGAFPKWQFRLLRLGKARFTDYGHGQKEGFVQGRLEYVNEPYLHFTFNKGWSHWLARHNHYSNLEAHARFNMSIGWKDIFFGNDSLRNKSLKPLVSRIPGWPLIFFMTMYFLRLGFLEGKPAFIYCINLAYYEFLIQIKIAEIKVQK
jgi:glycosyltransferase involved in cell wall biosynthesis